MLRQLLCRVGIEQGNPFTKPARPRRTLRMEQLEPRNMFAADFRTITEIGNNLAHPTWGSTGADLIRVAAAAYSDGIDDPAGATRASARTISNLLAAQSDALLNDRDLSAFIYAWGQFIDHDMDLTESGTVAFNVAVPKGDPMFDPLGTGTKTISLNRSQFDAATGTSTTNPRQQINMITAFLDGSMIYGSDNARALALRTLSGGLLKTSEGNLLPYNTLGLANGIAPGGAAEDFFVAGDVRANENIELTALQTLFMREHNRIAARYASQNRNWTDEQVYQAARKIVIAELQAITYNEFLPALLGPNALTPYKGYNPAVNPGIANEFSTAAFRLGHSLVGMDVEFMDNNGEEVHEEVEMRDNFFSPELIEEAGIDPILKYLASDRAQELDNHVVDDLRNFLFGAPGQGGLDLASLNIQRGRDHGLADYNSVRVAYGLSAVRTFADITKNVEVQQALKAAYGNVNNIDLWVGGLAEDHRSGGSVGPLFTRIIADQFQRLRDGDRFWYQRSLSAAEQAQVRETSLADVIRCNTTTTNLQENVFFFRANVSGRVMVDFGGRRDVPLPVRGLTVQLWDSEGTLVGSTKTARDGSYMFAGLDLTSYRVTVVLPRQLSSYTPEPLDVTFTRGGTIKTDAMLIEGPFGRLGQYAADLLGDLIGSLGGQRPGSRF